MKIFTETSRGKSDVPMIAGIIGFVATIPGTICAGVCGALTNLTGSGIGSFWIMINLVSSVAGLYFGITSKANPRSSGIFMLISAVVTLLIGIMTLNWFWGLLATAGFGIGGAVSLTQEKGNA